MTAILLILCFSSYSQAKIGNIRIPISKDYSISMYDGDNEKYSLIVDTNSPIKINVIYFLKTGKANVEYSPSSGDIKNIEDYINGLSDNKPFSWPMHYRKTYFGNLKRYIIDTITLNEFELNNIQFKRNIIFTDSKYCYNISVIFENAEQEIPKRMPEYIMQGDYGPNTKKWISNKLDSLYKAFENNQKITSYIDMLIEESNELLKKICLVT